MIAIVPVVVLFALIEPCLVDGLTAGSVKSRRAAGHSPAQLAVFEDPGEAGSVTTGAQGHVLP